MNIKSAQKSGRSKGKAAEKKSEDNPRLIALLKALSHPARVQILRTLAQKGTCVCGEIVEVFPLAQSTVSQHLKVLKDSGLVQGEVEGVCSCYCINAAAIDECSALLDEFFKELRSKSAGACGPVCEC